MLSGARFLLELCMLAALAVAGAAIGWWAAILLPLALLLVWGRLVAPKSPRRLSDPARLLLELSLAALAGGALAAAGMRTLGIAVGIASAAVALLLRRPSRSP